MNLCELLERTKKSALRSTDGAAISFSVRARQTHISRIKIYGLIGIICIISACNQKETRYKIPETPAFNQEYYQKALTVVNEALEDDPDNADAYFKKSSILLAIQQPDNALANIDKAISLAGSNPDYSLIKIRAHANAGEMQEAFKEAQTAIKTGNASEELYSIVAEGNLQDENYRQAIRYANAAIALNPKSGENYYRKGMAYAAISDTASAATQFLQSLENGKPPEAVYGALVKMYIDFDNYQQAYQYLGKMDLENDIQMQFQKARILRRVGQTDSATVLFYSFLNQPEKLSEIGEISVYKELKDIYTEASLYDSTLFYAEKILALDENDKETMIDIARVYDRRRAYAQSVEAYNRILRMDSTLQPQIHKLAAEELDYLERKIAYLQRRREEENLRKQLAPVAPLRSVEPQGNN